MGHERWRPLEIHLGGHSTALRARGRVREYKNLRAVHARNAGVLLRGTWNQVVRCGLLRSEGLAGNAAHEVSPDFSSGIDKRSPGSFVPFTRERARLARTRSKAWAPPGSIMRITEVRNVLLEMVLGDR